MIRLKMYNCMMPVVYVNFRTETINFKSTNLPIDNLEVENK